MSKRPPATPRRRVRSRHRFRIACRSPFSAPSPAVQSHSQRPQTCFEGPFGEVLRATGPIAKANPFRFSTKFQDDETDLLYYGYRYYNASTGRWLNRDPLEEYGGLNVYGFSLNRPTSVIDLFGLGSWEVHEKEVDLTAPGISVKALANGDANGFEVIYKPDPGECKEGKIVLFQSVSSTGLRGDWFPLIDRGGDAYGRKPKTGCPLPPPMKPQGSTPYSYIDSPGSTAKGWFGVMRFHLTAVAVCRKECQEDKVLSTYYFEFDNETRKISDRNEGYREHYESAMGTWNE